MKAEDGQEKGKISINNIFDDENFAELSSQPEGYQYCCYIYNQNYYNYTKEIYIFKILFETRRKLESPLKKR